MAFTNNRVDFFENESYTEELHAFALGKGIINVVKEGLDLTGNVLSNGYFSNGGALGQLGNVGETETITSNFTGFLVIKTTYNSVHSESEIIESATMLNTPVSDKSNVKYFTIYELNNGVIVNDYRYSNFISDIKLNYEDGLSVSVNGKESDVVPLDLTGAEQRVLRISEAGITDDDFSGMIFDQAIELIADKLSYTVIFNDTLSSAIWPNLTQAIADKHKGETEVGFFYQVPSIGYPSKLEIRPNGKNYCYSYTTDNQVTPITKYGDFCTENMENNHFAARNTGNYINKLKETSNIIKIGFFGDSLTRGFDSVNGTSQTYIDDNGDALTSPVVRPYGEVLIEDYLNEIYNGRFTYENMGWSGGTVEDLYKRYWKPRDLDACIIMIGTNDDSYNLTPEKYEFYYSSFIERQLYFGVIPIIVGSITKRDKTRDTLNTYRMIAKKLAAKYNLYYVDGGEITSNADETLYSDSTHLNVDGYAYLGRCLSVPLIEDAMSGKQEVKSGTTILFNDSDNVFKTDGLMVYSTQFPTPAVSGAGTGEGSAITLAPGKKIFVPLKTTEDALYIFPQIYFANTFEQLTFSIGDANKVPQMKNGYYEIGTNWSAPIARYGRWTTTVSGPDSNYRLHTVYNLIGAVETNQDTANILVCGQKGEQLLILENKSTTENITVHLIEFLSEKDYLLATKQAGSRYYKDGTSPTSTLTIEG